MLLVGAGLWDDWATDEFAGGTRGEGPVQNFASIRIKDFDEDSIKIDEKSINVEELVCQVVFGDSSQTALESGLFVQDVR